jgi:hypothetical protein
MSKSSRPTCQLHEDLQRVPDDVKPDLSQEIVKNQNVLNSLLDQIQALRSVEEPSRTPQEYVDLRKGLPSRFEEVKTCLQNV